MGEPVSCIFPAAEFEGRISRLQAKLAQNAQDAILLTTAADIFWATGFLTRFWESPARPWFLLVPASGAPVAVIPSIGAELMGHTWIKDIRTWDAPDPVDDGLSLLADTIAEVVPKAGTLAMPMGLETHARMPLGDIFKLTDIIAPRRIVDGTSPIQRAREIKSEAEIEKIREICTIAGRAFDRIPQIVQSAPRLDRVFRSFQAALLEEGADWVSYTAGGAGPGGYGDVISPAGAQPLQRGDILMLDTGAVKDGYFCDYDRNFAIGPPNKDAERGHAVLLEATDAALQSLRPGHTAADAHRILIDAITSAGSTAGGGRLGHGLGVTLTEWPSFTPKDTTPLRQGMVLTLEPSVEIAGGRILVHEENIVLRASGPELLSPRAPNRLPEITL